MHHMMWGEKCGSRFCNCEGVLLIKFPLSLQNEVAKRCGWMWIGIGIRMPMFSTDVGYALQTHKITVIVVPSVRKRCRTSLGHSSLKFSPQFRLSFGFNLLPVTFCVRFTSDKMTKESGKRGVKWGIPVTKKKYGKSHGFLKINHIDIVCKGTGS